MCKFKLNQNDGRFVNLIKAVVSSNFFYIFFLNSGGGVRGWEMGEALNDCW